MLMGQAKIDYQREYMRRLRAKRRHNAALAQKQGIENARGCPTMDELKPVRPVRPVVRPVVRPPLTKEQQVSRKGFNG